jgi:hypothetical protein
LHDYELANAVAPVNPDELVTRAVSLLPVERSGYSSIGSSLAFAVAGGPTQSILRPIEIEKPSLAEAIQKDAMFGEHRLFDQDKGCDREIERRTLVLEQERGARISLDEQGAILLTQPVDQRDERFRLPVLIEETVHEQLLVAVGFTAWLLDLIDSTQRLTHAAGGGRDFRP